VPGNLFKAFCLIPLMSLSWAAVGESRAPYQVVQEWSAASGLPTETISSLAIDHENQLWLGSTDGVVRYQGFDFRHFHRGTTPALPGNRVMEIHPAPRRGVVVHFEDGKLGFLSESTYLALGRADAGHLAVFDDRVWFISAGNGTLHSWSRSGGLSVHESDELSALHYDDFGRRLLLGAADGRVLALSNAPAARPAVVAQAAFAVRGIAAGPGERLLILGPSGASEHPGPDMPAAPARLTRWAQEQSNGFRATWTERGWLVANLRTGAGVGPNLLDGTSVRRLPVLQPVAAAANRSPGRIEFRDDRGRRWTNDGTRLFRDGQLMYQGQERILSFVVDPYDQLWIAQPRGGLRLLKQNFIQTLGREPGQLPDPNIYMVAEHDGQVLIGNWMGLTRFDPATSQWTQLLERYVTEVMPTPEGLLIGEKGICLLTAPNECREVPDFPARESQVLLLHRDRRGALWAGTEEGLYRRDPAGNWSPAPLDGAVVRTVLEDDLGRLTFGTRGQGLLIAPIEGESQSRPFTRVGPRQGLPSGFVRAILGLSEGGALVGTEDAGLCLLNRAREVIRCMSTKDGLPHHSVHYMLVDAKNRLWVNSNYGVYNIDLSTLLSFLRGERNAATGFRHFGVRDGLPSLEGNGGVHQAGAIVGDGTIWFPNQFGLVSIRPDIQAAQLQHKLTPRIRVVRWASERPLELPTDNRHLQLDLAAISLASPENVEFRYRFARDSKWTELGTRRHLNFRDLKPGPHQIEVDARHVGGPWSGEHARLDFLVRYRLHEHPAFQSLLALLLLAGVGVFWWMVRRRKRSLENQIEATSSQLAEASHQVATLGHTLRQVDVEHRSALRAISKELRTALDAAFQPLLGQRERSWATREHEGVRKQTRMLRALIDQIASFGKEPAETTCPDSSTGADRGAREEPDSSQAAEPENELTKSEDLVRLIRMEVLLHLSDPAFSVDDLAERLCMSRSVLYRRVAECNGSGPAELIREIRLNRAAELLIESGEQISTIAYSTGFASVSAFSRAFSRKMGSSPRQWRKLHREL
jgi:AraC-like DNA-binding protein/ligand-binding sensor domain-containing protein